MTDYQAPALRVPRTIVPKMQHIAPVPVIPSAGEESRMFGEFTPYSTEILRSSR
jgi:hypothetical protein